MMRSSAALAGEIIERAGGTGCAEIDRARHYGLRDRYRRVEGDDLRIEALGCEIAFCLRDHHRRQRRHLDVTDLDALGVGALNWKSKERQRRCKQRRATRRAHEPDDYPHVASQSSMT